MCTWTALVTRNPLSSLYYFLFAFEGTCSLGVLVSIVAVMTNWRGTETLWSLVYIH